MPDNNIPADVKAKGKKAVKRYKRELAQRAIVGEDNTTVRQRAYFHTLHYLIAEATRPRDGNKMHTELNRLYGEARRRAKLQRLAPEEWQQEQERLLVELMDQQVIPVPEDLRMVTE